MERETVRYRKTKLLRKNKKYSTLLLKETGIKSISESNFLAICNVGLVNGVQQETIIVIFSQYVILRNVIMIPGKSYCFVECNNLDDAKFAYNTIHGKFVTEPFYMGGRNHFERCVTDHKKLISDFERYIFLLVPERSFQANIKRKPTDLTVIEDFISTEEEDMLSHFVQEKCSDLESIMKHRSVMHYGYIFDYKTNNVMKNVSCKPIPREFYFIIERLQSYSEKFQKWSPNQLTINKYQCGQGIPFHIDTHSAFDDVILSLSINSDTVMDFKNKYDNKFSIFLGRKSLLILSDESRYAWQHGITPRKYDIIESDTGLISQKRQERISFTFRQVRNCCNCYCAYSEFCDSQKNRSDTNSNIHDEIANKLENVHVHQVYNQIANHFSKTRHRVWPNVAKFIESFEKGAILIDVGCGNGKYLGVNSAIYKIGCDRNKKLAAECRAKQGEILVCDCLRLPFRNDIADYCICIAVIHHLSTESRRLEAINELIRILSPGGKILIYVWAKNQQQNENKSSYLRQCNRNKQIFFQSSKSEIFVDSTTEYCSSLKFHNIDNIDISLPVHMNRTQFKYQDMLVPWKLQSVSKLNSLRETKYLRYYHVFMEGELEGLCAGIRGIKILKSYYDQGNWCILLQKSHT